MAGTQALVALLRAGLALVVGCLAWWAGGEIGDWLVSGHAPWVWSPHRLVVSGVAFYAPGAILSGWLGARVAGRYPWTPVIAAVPTLVVLVGLPAPWFDARQAGVVVALITLGITVGAALLTNRTPTDGSAADQPLP